MSVAGIPITGPFRGLVAHDEASASLFFGRAAETATVCAKLAQEGARVTALTGESGVGKTSLLRGGVVPALTRQGVFAVYIGDFAALDQEIWQAASRVRAEPPGAGESAADYLVRLARGARGGAVLILDHLERLYGPAGNPLLARQVGNFVAHVANAAGPRLKLLLSIDADAFHRLDDLYATTGFSPLPGAWTELPRLSASQITEIFEQTVLQTGTFLEAGLASVIAGDLCRDGACLPVDLQIVARSVLDLRLTSIRRYERSGGAEILIHGFFERLLAEAGGAPARRVLLEFASSRAELSIEEVATRTFVPKQVAEPAIASLAARGLIKKCEGGRGDKFALTHPALGGRIEAFAATVTARAKRARRALRKRVLSGGRLNVLEQLAVRRHLGRSLAADEHATFIRSFRRSVFHAAVGAIAGLGLLLAIYFDLRTSYSIEFDPPLQSPNGRVVARLGRPSLSFLYFLPSSPSFGAVFADTGFSATSVGRELQNRVATSRATGPIERDPTTPVPAWLRTVVDGLRPVPRGIALVLLGDPNGVVSLKQAFADPTARREVLEVLAVIGSGRAGEDEILAAALADASPEVRRRGVDVAAAIDRRRGKSAQATTLRTALADRSFDVRSAVLRECTTLDPATAASILSVALADKDASFRRLAEKAVVDLAERSPAAGADAVRLALQSTDALARKTALALLEQIALRNPEEAASALGQIAADDKAPEETRVAALVHLRRTGTAPETLRPFLEAAVSPSSSPRLRTAALPLYARFIEPEQAEELAMAESKGSASARASGAAVWGTVALKRPEPASRALKGMIYDPSPEVRVEAARSLGHLRRDGAFLISKMLLDPNTQVQRAAVDSAVTLAPNQPYAVPELLGRALLNVRPATRLWIVEALGQVGRERAQLVVAPLARALKLGDGPTRIAAAETFCALARKSPAVASPYVRMASRDADRNVRTTAAACLGSLTGSDPKTAARLATELANAEEASVRVAAAASLATLAPTAKGLTLAPLEKLLGDSDRLVRLSAMGGIANLSDEDLPEGKRRENIDRVLSAILSQGDVDERHAAVRTAGRLRLPALLKQAATDKDESLRLAAVQATADWGPSAVDILQAAVDDRAPTVRAEATRRLAAVSGEGAATVLPIFEAMLRSSDIATRRAGAAALGDFAGASDRVVSLLGEALVQRGESVRAAAAAALAKMAERGVTAATPLLEQALTDPAYDVRIAATWGLGAVWAKTRSPADLGTLLAASETDSARRLVVLEALVVQAQSEATRDEARKTLGSVAGSGPPLARLMAEVGRAFMDAPRADLHAFIERLLGG